MLALLLTLVLTVAITPTHATEPAPMTLHDQNATTLDGRPLPLSTYDGKVVLVVNTASECGFTPQYAGLQKLHTELADRGFTVLGVPSNEFGGQEPGTPQQIADFTSTKFEVTFPLLEKSRTNAPNQSPLYAFLTRDREAPKWNFHKYLVGRDGKVRASFPSRVAPESPELRQAILEALDE